MEKSLYMKTNSLNLFLVISILFASIITVVFNPYNVKIRLRIKCNYNQKLKKFEYDKTILINEKNKGKFILPNNIKRCQVWPKVIWNK